MPNGVEFFHGNYIEKEIEYFLFNTVTQETVTLCHKYDDVDCIAGLQENGLSHIIRNVGTNRYDYPAIYKSLEIIVVYPEEEKDKW